MFKWLFSRPNTATLDERGLSLAQLRTIYTGPPTLAGVMVNEEIALGIAALYRGVDLIASTIAGLEGETYRATADNGNQLQPGYKVTRLLRDPNEDINHFKFLRTLIQHVVCSGNGFSEIERDSADNPIGLHLIHWRDVEVKRSDSGRLYYRLRKKDLNLDPKDMLHITKLSWDGILGISPISAARESLALGIAQERYQASVFGNGAVPRGILKHKGAITPETKAGIRDAWETIHGGVDKSNKVAILSAETDWVQTNFSPVDIEILGARGFSIDEVARVLGVPPNLLFSDTQSSYNSNQEANEQFLQLGLKSILESLESEIDFKLFDARERASGYFFKFKTDSLIRGNFQTASEAWSNLVIKSIATPNEARSALSLNPLPEGDALYRPANMVIATDPDGTESVTVNGEPVDGLNPNPETVPADVPDVASTALNGAQIASLLEIVAQVTAGSLPLDSARGMIEAGFPTLSAAQIDAILAPLAQSPAPSPEPATESLRLVLRSALSDQVARALRRQAKSPDPVAHRAYLIDALASTHRAYCLAVGSVETIEQFADRWLTTTGVDPGTEGLAERLIQEVR